MFKATFRVPTIDTKRWLRDLKEEMTERVAQMAAGYLVGAMESIPKWSAASYMTFLELAREIQFSVDTTQVPMSGFWRNIANKNRAEALSSSDGFITIDEKKGIFTFTYSTSLKHLVYNEYNNANESPDQYLIAGLVQPGPYHFQEAAQKSALSDVEVSIPQPNMIVRTVTVK